MHLPTGCPPHGTRHTAASLLAGLTILLLAPVVACLADPAPSQPLPTGDLTHGSRTVATSSGHYRVQIVSVPLGSYRIQCALARGKVGATESLEGMARRYGAAAIINGSYFDAYSNRSIRNPDGTLITGGKLVYLASLPTTLGYWPDGHAAIGRVRFGIVGGVNGSENYPCNWYAYRVNHLFGGSSGACLYDAHYASAETPAGGTQVEVVGGSIVRVGSGPLAIPRDGWVAVFSGEEAYLARRFLPGKPCGYRLALKNADPPLDWATCQEGLSCGPLLVLAGKVVADPASEGFKDPKVLTGSAIRSAVGLTGDGHLLMVTGGPVTIPQWAQVMQALGCREAMSLDSADSAGLWAKGAMLVRPGRALSNALAVIRR